MTLGVLAVGVVIFAIVAVLLGLAVKSIAEATDLSVTAFLIIVTVCVYCAISGTYFLYAAGKI